MGLIGNLSELGAALRRRASFILLVLVVGLPVMLLIVQSRSHVYEATAVIQIEAPEITLSTNGQISGVTADGQLDLITQNLMARGNMEAMIAARDLFPQLRTDVARVGALRAAITIEKLVDPAQSWRPDVQPTGLSINVRLGDPEDAEAVANALLDSIIREARDRAEGRAERTLEFLVSEEDRVSTQIIALESQIADFRTAHIDSLPEGVTAQRERLNELTRSRLALEQQRIELQANTGRMRSEDAAAQERLLREQIELVTADITTVEAAIATAPEVERQLTALIRSRDQLTAQLTVLTTQRTEAATAELISSREQAARFSVLERAQLPIYPVSISRTKLAIAGGVAVGLLAIGLALLLELANPVIRNARQMERLLGVQPVIVVPSLRSSRTRRRRRLGVILGFGLLVAAGAALLAVIGRLTGMRRIAPVPVAIPTHR